VNALSDEAWRYLETLPRRTLTERITYWEVRHDLEAAEPGPRRVRAYVPPVVSPPARALSEVR